MVEELFERLRGSRICHLPPQVDVLRHRWLRVAELVGDLPTGVAAAVQGGRNRLAEAV